VPKEMLINVSQGEECRIALVEDGKLEELYMERTSSTSHVGNIYKGRVTNVEPSIQAAFVDFGLGRNGFLHISDLMPNYFGRAGVEMQETVGRKIARRDRPPIQRCLRRGDEIIVQIIKEGIGTKGPTLSTYLSIPGRILVMMPGMSKMGISRKIEDEDERRRLRHILDALKPPKDVGFIIRTAGVGKSKTEIQRDLTYLTRLWTIFVKKRDSGPGPMELYTEGDLVTRSVRDVFTSDIDCIVVDDKEVAKRIKEVVKLANPRTKNKVDLYEGPLPLFHKYGIEREIELMYSRHVPLPSGGSLVIDSTEAIVAIDVNSGKFREHADAETTAFRTDMEAADEIPRQLRLRDLGGVIICDFIDLRFERHRRELEARLHANFQKDRAKTKVLHMSQFGIIELTRQRMRPSLKRSIYFDCPHCKGAGLVKTPESMSLDVMRRLAVAMNDLKVARVEMTVGPDVNFYLQNKKRGQIVDLEQRFGKRVVIRSDPGCAMDEVRLELFDSRDAQVYLEELGMVPPGAAHPPRQGRQGRVGAAQGRGRRDDFARRGQGPNRQPQPPAPAETEREEFDLDQVDEDEVEPEEELAADVETSSSPQPESEIESTAELAEVSLSPPVGAEGDNRGRRRRRGRRGGRGRNRGPQNQQPAFEPVEVSPIEPPAQASPDQPESTGHRRRGRRGGRRRGRGQSGQTRQPPPLAGAASSGHDAPRASEAPTLTRTGSADKHLINDEPVAPQPVSRPRSVRDLDSIPDDYD
jgi:ribonuclease E